MNRFAMIGLIPMAVAAPAAAQQVAAAPMPGMSMPIATPAKAAPNPAKAKQAPTRRGKASRAPVRQHNGAGQMSAMPGMTPPPHAAKSAAGHDMSAMPGMQMPTPQASGAKGMTAAPSAATGSKMADMPGMQQPGAGATAGAVTATPSAAEPEISTAPPPPPPTDHAADRFYDPIAMAAARAVLREEHGGATFSKLMANLAEYQARSGGGAGYRWEGQAWFGGDINRLVLKSEGEGSRRDGLERAEVQGLYSRATGPYFNLQAGVRQDFKPRARTYATVGVEGLAPYWFDLEGALFLSNKGELLGRAEATYDLRLAQRLILQPRVELNLAAQDTRETRTGSGLSNAELGLRLRYEITREFAPYVGVSYDRKFSRTASYARALGEAPAATSFVVGIRTWF